MEADGSNRFGIDQQVWVELITLASVSKDFDSFLTDAYQLDEIGDPKVQDAVDDEVSGVWSAVAK